MPVSTVRCASGAHALACMIMRRDEHRLPRAAAVRSFASALVVGTLAFEKRAMAEDEEEGDTDDASDQIIDLDGINGKKLAIVGGAFVVADVISGLLTGRSILPLGIIGIGNKGGEDWKSKVVSQLLEDEKKKAAAKMGVSVTTSSEKKEGGRVSSTGEYAKTDPFEIAKTKYAKKPSIEDLKRDLGKKLDTKEDDDDY